MDLKADVCSSLATLAGDDGSIDDGLFKQLVKESLTSILVHSSLKEQSPSILPYNHVISALSYLFLEASKLNAQSLEISTLLDEVLANPERIKYICQEYDAYKSLIRKHLEETQKSFSFLGGKNHLKDVDWRLDYVIKTSELSKFNEPIYTIRLKCDGEGQDLEMTCTVEQLQDLYSKLRDATSQVRRLLKK